MDRGEALTLKAQLSEVLFAPPELPFERVFPARMRGQAFKLGERAAARLPFEAATHALRRVVGARAAQPSFALGVSVDGKGEHQLVALVQATGEATDTKLKALRAAAGDVEVQPLGRVIKQSAWPRGEVRPLRIGSSISTLRADDAGTLGCFVRKDGVLKLLSNNHVLAGENAGRTGDPIVQPGTRDKGAPPADVVATLAEFVPLRALEPNLVDCALATVADGCEVDPAELAGGRLAGVAGDEDAAGKEVEKLGRTSKATRGTVTVIELDNVIASYGLGDIRFDGVMQIESTGASPFSKPGDSGSLIYTADSHLGVGLLFAATVLGGELGGARSFACPLSTVLQTLDATLVL